MGVLSFRYDLSVTVGIEGLCCHFEEVKRGKMHEERRRKEFLAEQEKVRKLGRAKKEGDDGFALEDAPSTTAAGESSPGPSSPGGGGGDKSAVVEQYPGHQQDVLKDIRNILKFRRAAVLDLSRKPVGEAGALAMAKGFLEHGGGQCLLQLCLWGCQLGDKGAAWLFQQWPATLRVAWLDDNDITNIPEDVLPQPGQNSLEELYLAGNRLGVGNSVVWLLQRLRNLQSLDIAGNGIGAKRGESILRYITTQQTGRTVDDDKLEDGEEPEPLALESLSAQKNKFSVKSVKSFLEEWDEKKTMEKGSKHCFNLQFVDMRFHESMGETARAELNILVNQSLPTLVKSGCIFKIISDDVVQADHARVA